LEQIIAGGDARRSAAFPVAAKLANIRIAFGAGRLEYVSANRTDLYYLALAFILEPSRGLTERLGQCRAPGCGRFNLTFKRRARFYCNDEHRLAFDKLDAPRRAREHRRRRADRAASTE
jgi:hypothetical protein